MTKNKYLILVIGIILIMIPVIGMGTGTLHVLGGYVNSGCLISGIIFIVVALLIAIENS